MTEKPFSDRFTSVTASAGQTVLAWDFKLMIAEGLTVVRNRAGVSTRLNLGDDYSFPAGLGGEAGGTLTLAQPATAGDVYQLIGLLPEVRVSDFLATQAFATAKINADLDYLTQVMQEHRRDIGRAYKSGFGVTAGHVDPLPAGHFHKVDAAGNLVDAGLALPLPAGGNPGWRLQKASYADGDATWTPIGEAGEGEMPLRVYDPAGKAEQIVTVTDLAVSVKDFGAKGDGVTDDSAAIQAANNSGAAAIHFPPGQYLASGLVMTAPWFMDAGAEIVFNGAQGKNCIAVTGNGLRGNLNVSGDGKVPATLVYILGDDSHFSRIAVRDVVFPPGASPNAALKIGGKNNIIDTAVGCDLVNTGSIENDSCPQFVTFGGGSDGNTVGTVLGHRIRAGVLNYSEGENSVGTIFVRECEDNGFYCSQPGKFTIGTLRYSGTDEAAVFINHANAIVGKLIVDKADTAAFDVSDADFVDIGEVVLHSITTRHVFRTRTTNVASKILRVGRISGEVTAESLFWTSNGTIDFMSVGEIDLTYIYDTAVSGSIGSWGRLNLARSVNIGCADITIVDKNDVLTGSSTFIAYLPESPTKRSHIGSFNVHIVGSDRITLSAAAFQLRNIANSMVQIDNGRLQTNFGPYLREVNNSDRSGPGLYANTVPTLGTWMKGTLLWFYGSSAGTAPGVYCVASGTFGTLSGVTGSFTSGLFTGTVNDASSLVPGQYITIAGVTGVKRIVSIIGTTVKLDSAADATVSNAAVAWSAPVFKALANMAS